MAAKQTVQRRIKRPESRRQELLEAALKLFIERGVSEPTVADVTSAAGAAKGTFYRYFESKEDLIAALEEDYTERLCVLLVESIEGAESGGRWSQVEALVQAASEFYIQNADVHHLLFRAGTHGHAPDGELSVTRPFVVMRDLIEAGVRDGSLSCDDVELTTYLLFSALHAALDLELGSSGIGHERLVRGMLDLISKALQPSRGPNGDAKARTRRRPLFTRA